MGKAALVKISLVRLVPVIGGFIFLFLAAPTTHAISNVGPDPREYGTASGTVGLSLIDEPSVPGATSMLIPLYARVPESVLGPGNVTVKLSNVVHPDPQIQAQVCVSTRSGTKLRNVTANTQFTVNSSDFSWDTVNQIYRADIQLTKCDGIGQVWGNEIQFRLIAPNNTIPANGLKYVFGYTPPLGNGVFHTDNQGGNGYANYSLSMATPCDISSNTSERITLIDLDSGNGNNGGAQITLRVHDETSGTNADVTIYNEQQRKSFTSGDNLGTLPNNATTSFTMTFKPNHHYTLHINNIIWYNVLEYRMPYDNISAYNGCPPKYNLYPDAMVNGAKASAAAAGTPVAALSTVYDSGPSANMTSGHVISQFKVPAGQTLNPALFNGIQPGGPRRYVDTTFNAGSDPCPWLKTNPGFGGIVCEGIVKSGTRKFNNGNPNPYVLGDTSPINTDSYQIGEQVCRIVSVSAYDYAHIADNQQRVSIYACVKIAVLPSVQIWGNDLRVGSGLTLLNNNLSVVQGGLMQKKMPLLTTFGSWAEYGIVAPHPIINVASGSGLAGGSVNTGQSSWSKLTFANANNSYGSYAGTQGVGLLPNIANYFTDPTHPKQGVTLQPTVGDVNVNGFTANSIVNSTGTVTITGDITNPNQNISNESGIQQMIIIAKNININENVKNIDAWLIAPNGIINTCARNGDQRLTTSICKDQLTITGPVQAKHLTLRRTASGGDTAAEKINLRGDSYIWAHHISEANSSWQTKFVTELPPRY